MGEEPVGEKYMGEKSVGQKSVGEKYMWENLWVKNIRGKKGQTGLDGFLAFTPPSQVNNLFELPTLLDYQT